MILPQYNSKSANDICSRGWILFYCVLLISVNSEIRCWNNIYRESVELAKDLNVYFVHSSSLALTPSLIYRIMEHKGELVQYSI